MDQNSVTSSCPHLPFPILGHVSSTLKLAELFCLAGIDVTFLNFEHNHSCLLRYTDVRSHFGPYIWFNFETIPDGLPADHPCSGDRVMELFHSIRVVMKSQFQDILISGRLNYEFKPVTCIIVDRIMCFTIDVAGEVGIPIISFRTVGGIMCFTIDVAGEVGIPIISFRTVGASCFWTFSSIPKLIETGKLPLRGDDDMDRSLSGVSGMESFLRIRDLPSWPYFADQQVNSRFVGEVWRVRMDMKDTCDRLIVEKMIKDLIEVRIDEFVRSADRMAKMARKSVREGGSSHRNLDRRIDDIKPMIHRFSLK